MPLPSEVAAAQRALGAQSLRGVRLPHGVAGTIDALFPGSGAAQSHAASVFRGLVERERDMSGEWAVFYHSYSHAAVMYEVQAAAAAVTAAFPSHAAALPRLLRGRFDHIPDAASMLREFKSWRNLDENKAFRECGICVTTNLLAHDSEATPWEVFASGYSIGTLSSAALEHLLRSCGVPKGQVRDVAAKVISAAAHSGLETRQFGGQRCASGRPGHLLQVFVHRSCVDVLTYAAHPWGVPDETRWPLSQHLLSPGPIAGQARITANPAAFLRQDKVRLYTVSADPEFHRRRADFQQQLAGLLAPHLEGGKVRWDVAWEVGGE